MRPICLLQMLYIKKNPYVWSASAQDVTSPVMSVSLKGDNNTAISVEDLNDPVAISLTNFGKKPAFIYSEILVQMYIHTCDNIYCTYI